MGVGGLAHLGVVEPVPPVLRPVEQQRRRRGDRDDPDDEDEDPRPSLGEPRLDGEHDAEETIAGDQRQRHDARDE